jgi:plastocyanin
MPTRRMAIALIAPLILVACSSATQTSAPTAVHTNPPAAASAAPPASTAAPASAGAVTIMGFAFKPATLDVAVGTTVTWTNQDSVGHTVTADDGSFDSGTVNGGATFSQVFSTAGTFAYHCKIHSSMHGTITVR